LATGRPSISGTALGQTCLNCISLGQTCLICTSLGQTCLSCTSLGQTCLNCTSLGQTCLNCTSLGQTCLNCTSLGQTCLKCTSLGQTCLNCTSLGVFGLHRLNKQRFPTLGFLKLSWYRVRFRQVSLYNIVLLWSSLTCDFSLYSNCRQVINIIFDFVTGEIIRPFFKLKANIYKNVCESNCYAKAEKFLLYTIIFELVGKTKGSLLYILCISRICFYLTCKIYFVWGQLNNKVFLKNMTSF
jgi:hypothetical protein